MTDILLVEDDRDLAATVVDYLELIGLRCDHAANGAQGLQLLSENRYDVLLLDLNLPRIDGLTVCRTLREQGQDIPVLMLTARDQLQDKLEGFDSGTDDFLVKPFELAELEVRIHALARRRSGQSKLLRVGDLSMDLNRHEVRRAGTVLKISPIGWQLLEALMRAAPAAVSRQKLEAQVWGDVPPDSNPLKVHMHHLRKVIDGGADASMVETVTGYGFALVNPSDRDAADAGNANTGKSE
ncbi:response regulator transcription factor [uncultured Thalassolituus sp.]|uniref:response regulator transcription factor n=1 Tax=uncultured Thalassolituus sp. TaxID=285273 RepID=UPI00260CFFBE|nr:response regulator transcription factor [uncultured Thalassolituus sp.]